MAIKFQIRGTQLNAWYATGKKGYGVSTGNVTVDASAISGVFGGSLLNFATSGPKALRYLGGENWATGVAGFTILMRIVPTFSGTPAATQALFAVGDNASRSYGGITILITSGGVINVQGRNADGTTWYADQLYGSPSFPTFVSGEPIDLWFRWNGQSGNPVECYQAAPSTSPTLCGSGNAYIAGATRNAFAAGSIAVGLQFMPEITTNQTNFNLNELVIWDSYETPSSYGARSNFITASEFEGYSSTDPGIANVKNAIGYTSNGVSLTGTLLESTPPAAADVRAGTNFILLGATVTGLLTASDPPDATDVREGVVYIDNGVTLTGSLEIPDTFSGTGNVINYAQIKENVRFILDRENTTTAAQDLSSGMTDRVKKVLTLNPGRIPVQTSWYPFVTMFIDSKNIDLKDIAINQRTAKREGIIKLKLVGAVWNSKTNTKTADEADDDCEKLMENIEDILRRDPTFSGQVLWQVPTGVTFHNQALDERANLRVGVLSFDVKLLY